MLLDKRFFESDGLEKQINDLGTKIDAFVAERRILCETIGSSSLKNEEQLVSPVSRLELDL